MEASILKSTKKNLGVNPEDNAFDVDIITHINSTFSTLAQLGVGPLVFQIEDESLEWSDFVEDDVLLNLIKTYVYLKVRLIFDPPVTSYTQTALEKQIEQFEWRISVYREGLEWTDPSTLPSGGENE